MNVIFYSVKDPKNKLSKKLASANTVSGHLKESCSILSPTIGFAYFSTFKNYNYAYIEEYGRYYFITDVTFDGHVLEMKMEVDPLMTWKTDILNSTGTAHRAQRALEKKDITDDMVETTSRVDIEVRTFGSGLPTTNSGNFILTTVI